MPLVERFVVGVDMQRFSGRITRHQRELQRALVRMLDESAEAAGLHREHWERRPEGDGETSVLPPGVDLLAVVRRYVSELDVRLTDHNEDHAPEMRIRLRLAMHTDVLTFGQLGYAGPALIVLNRLLDSAPVRAALTNVPEANLAQIISEPVFQRAVVPELDGLRRRQFARVRVDLPDKGFHQDAYLYVPRQQPTVPPVILPEPSRFPTGIFTTTQQVPPTRPPVETSVSASDTEPEPEAVEPAPVSPVVRELVEGVRKALLCKDIEHADALTTLAILESVGRARNGSLRASDGPAIPESVLTDVDTAWAEFSSGTWGFHAQRQRGADVRLSDPRAFRILSVLVGWRADEEETVSRYPEFARRGDRTAPFYPTLRDPERETYSGWHDGWKATVMSVHIRLRDWER